MQGLAPSVTRYIAAGPLPARLGCLPSVGCVALWCGAGARWNQAVVAVGLLTSAGAPVGSGGGLASINPPSPLSGLLNLRVKERWGRTYSLLFRVYFGVF